MVMRYFGQKYYYITGQKPSGGYFFLGPYSSESEARIKGYDALKGLMFDVFTSKHRDPRRAQAEYRPDILKETGSIDEATQRITHDPNKIM